MEKSFQKEAARRVILNRESGYYEPLSHFNYDVNDALIKKGVPREFLPSSLDRFPDYSHLGYEAIESIIHAFDLEISLSNSD